MFFITFYQFYFRRKCSQLHRICKLIFCIFNQLHVNFTIFPLLYGRIPPTFTPSLKSRFFLFICLPYTKLIQSQPLPPLPPLPTIFSTVSSTESSAASSTVSSTIPPPYLPPYHPLSLRHILRRTIHYPSAPPPPARHTHQPSPTPIRPHPTAATPRKAAGAGGVGGRAGICKQARKS